MIKCDEEELFVLSRCINKLLKFLEVYLKQKQEIVLS